MNRSFGMKAGTDRYPAPSCDAWNRHSAHVPAVLAGQRHHSLCEAGDTCRVEGRPKHNLIMIECQVRGIGAHAVRARRMTESRPSFGPPLKQADRASAANDRRVARSGPRERRLHCARHEWPQVVRYCSCRDIDRRIMDVRQVRQVEHRITSGILLSRSGRDATSSRIQDAD